MTKNKEKKLKYYPTDTEKQTFGCRMSNPDSCAKNSMPGICAFVREDGMCLHPPKSWKKRYEKLKEDGKLP